MPVSRKLRLVKRIYTLTIDGDFRRDFGLRDQIRRAAVSIPTNIAEGFERSSHREYIQFLNIAKGSAGEVRSLLRVSLEIGYIDQSQHDESKSAVVQISKCLSSQILSLKAKEAQ
ncbi:MAG: four helix bundle protein [Candidatus Coatesbacteria bacterium]|nr:four helix bundle protein [Candidatus Coatesbacteria bacterium]